MVVIQPLPGVPKESGLTRIESKLNIRSVLFDFLKIKDYKRTTYTLKPTTYLEAEKL